MRRLGFGEVGGTAEQSFRASSVGGVLDTQILRLSSEVTATRDTTQVRTPDRAKRRLFSPYDLERCFPDVSVDVHSGA